MSGLKEHLPAFQKGADYKITPDEIDRYEQYQAINLSISPTWFGTAAGGTSTQARALVIINKNADFPRNAVYSVAGSSDMGGTWVLNGKNQFGEVIQETVTIGTAANGGTVAGTKIFAQVTSGTCTITTGAVGSGSPRLGVAIGTAATLAYKIGLPTKIAAVSDVKAITWSKENVTTTLNGGTVDSTLVDITNHAFMGTGIMGGTETFTVMFKSTYDNSGKANLAGL